MNRDFTAPCPNYTWAGDFTDVRTWVGWVYVAFIVGVYSHKILGWHAMTTRCVDMVMIPLRMALWERARGGRAVGPGQLRAHSDAGAQYASILDTERLALDGISPSIGSVRDAYDNALM